MSVQTNKCNFVAGTMSMPRVFAQRTFAKLEEANLNTRSGKIIFRQGDEDEKAVQGNSARAGQTNRPNGFFKRRY